MATFQTKITRARFVHSPFSSEQMAGLGDKVLQSVVARIKNGINCEDRPAKPLKPGRNGKPGYPDYKARRGVAPIRNWISQIRWPRNRIKTLRAIQVKSANENRVVIGFIDPAAERIAHFNNKIDRQFGLAPSDKKVIQDAVHEMMLEKSPVSVKKTA